MSSPKSEAGHGRIERRVVRLAGATDWLTKEQRADWAGLQSIAVVESTRKHDNGKVEKDRRCFQSSFPPDASRLGRLGRNHWAIENGQHRCLDMAFDEDHGPVGAGHGDRNPAVVRRIALDLVKRDKSRKIGVANKRLEAASNPGYSKKVLSGTSDDK